MRVALDSYRLLYRQKVCTLSDIDQMVDTTSEAARSYRAANPGFKGPNGAIHKSVVSLTTPFGAARCLRWRAEIRSTSFSGSVPESGATKPSPRLKWRAATC